MRDTSRRLATLLLAFVTFAHASTDVESPVAPDQRRGAEQTLLTYPEWFLVHSPAEYATWVAGHPSHDFPFIAHVGQLWGSYAAVTREQWRERYPANLGYHVMILVIASSTTVEYGLRSAYENVAGRIGWALSSGTLTPEDRYGARVAQDYVDFIRKDPWYLFDFTAKLRDLWTTVPLFGADPIRKWEHRYALTTEYAVKAVYGKLIELATRSSYEPARPTTQVVVDHAPDALPDGVRLVNTLDDGRAVLDLPRYFDFRLAATALARSGSHLVDVAGNRGTILVTLWTRDAVALPDGSRVLFEQPIVTKPGTRRVGALVPVTALSSLLVDAPARGASIAHVYDY